MACTGHSKKSQYNRSLLTASALLPITPSRKVSVLLCRMSRPARLAVSPARLAVPPGDHGSLTLYGRVPGIHQLLAEHLTAEYRVKTSGRGRTVDEWKLKPEHHDNHWLDCLAGCAVCGSMLGCSLPEFGAVVPKKRGRIKLSERQGTHITTAEPRRKLKLSDMRRNV